MPRYLTTAACGALTTLVAARGSPVPPAGGGSGPTADAVSDAWDVTRGPDLPLAVGNNAVAAATVHGRPWLFSFLGLESGRDHRAITTRAFALDIDHGRWEALPEVPGCAGRLAATAQAIRERVYVFGGYEVAADGKETTSRTPKYGLSRECYRGDINPGDPASITWRVIPARPGVPRYRAAAGPVRTAATTGIMFVGGTANPNNYDGIGCSGQPADPEAATWIYDEGVTRGWQVPTSTDRRWIIASLATTAPARDR